MENPCYKNRMKLLKTCMNCFKYNIFCFQKLFKNFS